MSNRIGYWIKVNQEPGIDFSYIPPSNLSRESFDSMGLEQLSEFEFNQSTRQGFYFIESIEGVEDGVAVELYWAEFNHDDINRRTSGTEV